MIGLTTAGTDRPHGHPPDRHMMLGILCFTFWFPIIAYRIGVDPAVVSTALTVLPAALLSMSGRQ